MPQTTIEPTKPKPVTDHRTEAALRNFEAGVRYLQKQNYEKAKEIFEKLVTGAPPELADRVKAYLRICQQKTQTGLPASRNVDFYTLGVAELNTGRFEAALDCLSRANKSQPNREHILYALAAAYALQGNIEAALENLQVSISLRPQNRFQARHDEDFQSLLGDPRFRALVGLPSGTTTSS